MKFLIQFLFISMIFSQPKTSGLTFFQYDADGGFEIKRTYLTYSNKVTDNISFRLQADVGRINVGTVRTKEDTLFKENDEDSRLVYYLKNAKADWRSPFGKFTFGMQGMNMFNIQEKTWGHRFIEKSPMDVHKFSSSADLGIGYSNSIKENIHFSVMVTNGSGYKKPENDEFKKVSGQFVYGEKRLDKNEGYNAGLSFSSEPNKEMETTVYSAFGGYSGSGLRTGIELGNKSYSIESEDTLGQVTTKNYTEQITAFYGTYSVNPNLEFLVYGDLYSENKSKTDASYYILGMNWMPAKGLTISPNVRIKKSDKTSDNIYNLNFQFKF